MAPSPLAMKLSLVFLLTTLALSPPSTAAGPRRIITKLIGRHHTQLLSDTKARGSLDDTRSPVIAEVTGKQFMANLSIGTPPVPQLVTIDTGSDLLWIQCLPCVKCFQQASPTFDPSKSSTYTNIQCTSPSCNDNIPDRCDAANNCKFQVRYLDNTGTSGLMATEDLGFVTSDDGIVTVPHALIGCAHDSEGFPDDQTSGVLGLGASSQSIISQLGSKFSYCLGSIKDPEYAFSVLVLGDDANVDGDQTPLEVYGDHYYLTLESVSLGELKLEIDPNVFKKTPEGKGGVVIDSGSTATYMVAEAYKVIVEEVRKLLDGKFQRVDKPSIPSILCYVGVIERDLGGFPVVTFQFAGGAELALDVNSFFFENGKNSNEFCMAVLQKDDLNIIGVMAQQSYNVGFDIHAGKVTFQRIDCQLLN